MISSESQPKVNLKKVSVQQGFRLIIHNFLIIDDKVPEKVTLGDELVFSEKSWYLEMFTRLGSGGIPHVSCDKIFKSDKTMISYFVNIS